MSNSAKRNINVYDNIYGYIHLEKSRYQKILEHPLFLRLHNIKQMGYCNFVFPDAIHTRYSHSLGVYYLVKKMIEAQERKFINLSCRFYADFPNEKDDLLLSALLHDIGHLPLSHTVEAALERYEKFSYEKIKDEMEDETQKKQIAEGLANNFYSKPEFKRNGTKLHEQLGEDVLLNTSLHDLLVDELEVEPLEISNRFKGVLGDDLDSSPKNGKEEDKGMIGLRHSRNFLHSQLDADRIEYLLRDSTFTGVKSGAFDFEKLLAEIRYTETAKYGVHIDALRVLEQFFMARFAAYAQIVFHKRVEGYDLLAQDFYFSLLRDRDNPEINHDGKGYPKVFSYPEIKDQLMKDEKWFYSFTDSYFEQLIYEVLDTKVKLGQKIFSYAKMLQERKPFKCVYEEQKMCTPDQWENWSMEDSLITCVAENVEEFMKIARVSKDSFLLKLIPNDRYSSDMQYYWDLFYFGKALSIFDRDSKYDQLYAFKTGKPPEHLKNCESTFLKLDLEKLYVQRIFATDLDMAKRLEDGLKRFADTKNKKYDNHC